VFFQMARVKRASDVVVFGSKETFIRILGISNPNPTDRPPPVLGTWDAISDVPFFFESISICFCLHRITL